MASSVKDENLYHQFNSRNTAPTSFEMEGKLQVSINSSRIRIAGTTYSLQIQVAEWPIMLSPYSNLKRNQKDKNTGFCSRGSAEPYARPRVCIASQRNTR